MFWGMCSGNKPTARARGQEWKMLEIAKGLWLAILWAPGLWVCLANEKDLQKEMVWDIILETWRDCARAQRSDESGKYSVQRQRVKMSGFPWGTW